MSEVEVADRLDDFEVTEQSRIVSNVSNINYRGYAYAQGRIRILH